MSIIVAAFNAEDSITAALQSALEQSGVDVEILVVDDASTDGTADLVMNLAQSEPRIRLIRSGERRGPGPARNLALNQATGDWIAILDADDKFHTDRLTSLLAVARDHNADMVADNLWLVDSASGRPFDLMLPPKHIDTLQIISAEAFVRNNQPINIKRKYGLLKPIIRRDLIDRFGVRFNEETPYGSDFLFYVDCLVGEAKFVLVPEAYYFYELSRTQITRTRSVEQAESFLRHCNNLLHRDEIRSNPSLVRALTDRSEQLRSNLIYMRFRAALKKWHLAEALHALAARPEQLPYIARHIKRAAVLRSRQWCARFLVQRNSSHSSACTHKTSLSKHSHKT